MFFWFKCVVLNRCEEEEEEKEEEAEEEKCEENWAIFRSIYLTNS